MNSLLPPGSTSLERRLAQTCSGISDLQVPLRDLWNPATCPVSFQIAAKTEQHNLLTHRRFPPGARFARAQCQPVNPVGFEVASFHPTQPVCPVHFGDYTCADQVGDKAHDFG